MECSIDNCSNPVKARGWCGRHYKRWFDHGDPEPPGVYVYVTKAGEPRRFFEEAMLLETDDCIIWPYAKQRGYGSLHIGERQYRTHRLACERAHGDPPEPGMDAAHGPCGNRACINPRHLSWKTRVDNMADKERDGTNLRGSKHPNSKLTEDEVRAMRRLASEGSSQRELGDRYGVTHAYVGRIIRREAWAHV